MAWKSGYVEEQISSKKLGLNQNVKMISFDFIKNAGKGGADAAAFEAQFLFEGETKPTVYRLFEPTKAFYKENGESKETSDPNHPAFQQAINSIQSAITMIVSSFVKSKEEFNKIKEVESLEDYIKQIKILLLPKDFENVPLDLFLQFQYKIRAGSNKTYLEIPTSTKSGRFICKHVDPVNEWKQVTTNNVLKYVDEAGNQHPFVRNEMWLTSPVSKVQTTSEDDVETSFTSTTTSSPTTGNNTEKEDW
jgi:hypothetical protein